MRNDRVSHETQNNIEGEPEIDAVKRSISQRRHEQFQLGQNPMAMTEFEKSRVALEVQERKMACHKYIKGVQGRDGGCFPDDQTAIDDLITPLNYGADAY
jgi:hypothetical protein